MLTTIKIPLARWQQLFSWLLVLVSLIALALCYPLIKHGFVLETDLQSLFPKDSHNQLVNSVNDRVYRQFGNKILVAAQAPAKETASAAADILSAAITANPHLKASAMNAQMELAAQQHELLQRYRYQLLTPAQQQLINNNPQELLARAQAALFGFNVGGSALSPLQDPLSLAPVYAQQLQPAIKGELINDRLVVTTNEGFLILFALDLQGESFNLELQAQMNSWLQELRTQLAINPHTQTAQILVSGAVFHAAEASANAQREMSIIGGGSSLGVLLLFLLAFRRIKPLLLSLVSVAYGCGVALVINHFLFGKIHLMTLVFGASLIGVAVDYSLHYLCKYQDLSLRMPDLQDRGKRVLEILLPALSLSLIASVLGYSSLLPTPLPGLQQIALFSVIGLCGAWLFLVVIYPLLVRQPLPVPSAIIDRCAAAAWFFWQRMRGLPQYFIFSAIALVIIAGSVVASRSSDVRTLYKPSAQLMASEQRLHSALQGVSPNQYFLLRAESAEELLQLEERFRREHLDALVNAGAFSGYIATSAIVPSLQQQHANYALMAQQLYSANGLVDQFMQSAGFDAQAVAQAQSGFVAAQSQHLLVDEWLQVARPDQGLLWLGELNGKQVSIIGLRGVVDVTALAAAANNHSIIWIDRVAGMSQLLHQLMNSAAVLLLLAYVAILPLLWIYFRRKRALLLILVPLIATVTTLALLTLSGVAINLFHLFGCYLILGLGMDYGIFSYTQGPQDPVTQRAIFLSAVSSSLSFGLLALSSTPMVSAFGITLFLGCCFNWLYAPVAGQLRTPGPATTASTQT
ncbi:MMPL family transporter [Cellvibrio mixtus]|uniref:MMPL family transporter n=1 Tax=Cellvibrio mixtus TaxID=39650 RepID=UPI000586586B|nr:MMPL family transporter [Cellvibrio mixtus]